MTVAVVWAIGPFTTHTSPPTLALAEAVCVGVARAVVGAFHWAPLDITLFSRVLPILADADAVGAVAVHAVHALHTRAVKRFSSHCRRRCVGDYFGSRLVGRFVLRCLCISVCGRRGLHQSRVLHFGRPACHEQFRSRRRRWLRVTWLL